MEKEEIEKLAKIQNEEKKEDLIDYTQLTENSLKTIDELNQLFPHWSRENVLKKMKKTIANQNLRFVAKSKGTIIAHVKVQPKKTIHEHIADITSLIVLPDYRRKGIGIKLMKFALTKIPKKTKIITLAVDSKNKKAINLYKKMGFKKYGLLKNGSKINSKFINNYYMYKTIK